MSFSPFPRVSLTPFETPYGDKGGYVGPPLSAGPLPTLFYFALTAEESLCLDPYNQVVASLAHLPMRVFSLTLPGHTLGGDPGEALKVWSQKVIAGENFIEDFVATVTRVLDYLEQKGVLIPERIAAAGLSRGAFVATHLAARDQRVRYVLGFAPLTDLMASASFGDLKESSLATDLGLHNVAEALIDRHIRFYIGNHDTLVSTTRCFEFIRHVTQTAYHHKIRSPLAELIIGPSIGHKGHGTPPHVFVAGANWIKERMLLG